MNDLSKEAMDFVKNNCMTWCNFGGCSTRECEKRLNLKIMKTGIELITEERQKQIDKHGFTAEHHAINDRWYDNDQLQLAAHSLLAPELYEQAEVYDNLPNNWDQEKWDNLCNKSQKKRLIIAGALIAAELDRLNYIEENNIEGKV